MGTFSDEEGVFVTWLIGKRLKYQVTRSKYCVYPYSYR